MVRRQNLVCVFYLMLQTAQCIISDGWMGVEDWWNGTDGKKKLIYSEKNLSHSHLVHHNSYMDQASCNGADITTLKAAILIRTAIRISSHKR
jgi:hypothetical protein